MHICFFGVGGVGGYFGSLAADKYKDEHNVYFIARGSHKEAINNNGLTLKKDGGTEVINVAPRKCTDAVEDIPACDIIILSVKGYDLDNAAKDLAKITNKNTIVLPLLNGVDIYERIRKHLKTGVVLPSCVYVGTHIESPGVIYQKGGSCKIAMGADPEFPDHDLYPFIRIMTGAGIDLELEADVRQSIWSKYIFIAAYGLVTAAFDKTVGEVLDDLKLSKMVKSIMYEIEAVARKLSIPLEVDIVESSLQKARQFPYEAKTSFQRDVEAKGRLNEGDLFGGTILRYGKELKILTPNTKNVYDYLVGKFV